jgi:hypothetical protein
MFRARWRRWIRERTPKFLYDQGVVVPKVSDCGDHDWYRATAERDACYHCQVTRESPSFVMEEMRAFRQGHRLDGVTIRELIEDGRR